MKTGDLVIVRIGNRFSAGRLISADEKTAQVCSLETDNAAPANIEVFARESSERVYLRWQISEFPVEMVDAVGDPKQPELPKLSP